jgi:C2 domain
MVSLYPIQSFKVEMTIVQGRNLIGKDRHFLTRQRTTSDPYIIASLGMDQRLGQTKTCPKTLNPIWDATFHFTVPNKRHAQVPTNMSTFVRNTNLSKADDTSMIEACSMVLLKIYDEDKVTDDDMMGTLIIPIPVAPRSGLSTTMWYDVDTLFVPNAVGQVQVALTVTPEGSTTTTGPNSIFPSPETIARWTASVFGKKQQLNEHNLVVETETTDRKSYILAILKQLTT